MKGDPTTDPKALIREAYRIEGITEGECRSIFMDWALSLPEGVQAHEAIAKLLETYDAPDHPMTEVLRLGQERAKAPARRGGWKGRRRQTS